LSSAAATFSLAPPLPLLPLPFATNVLSSWAVFELT